MGMPTGFGDFWPEGDIELDPVTREWGWYERLKKFYAAQTAERRKELFDHDDADGNAAHFYAYYAVGKFIAEAGTRENDYNPPSTPIEAHETPRSFTAFKTYKSLASLISINAGIWAVDDDLKGIIERLEPGVHQYNPVEIIMPKGKRYPRNFSVMVLGQYIDSFSPQDTVSWAYDINGPTTYGYKNAKTEMTELAFSKAVFGKAHLWRERRIRPLITCWSDQIRTEIADAGLRMPKHYKMKEV